MYIREVKTKSKKTGKTYKKLVLIESYRTEKGPRQRTIMNLGSIDIPKSKWKELAFCLQMKLSGQTMMNKMDKYIEDTASMIMDKYLLNEMKDSERQKRESNKNIQAVDINSLAVIENRSLGAEMVVNSIWKRLGFERILSDIGFSKRQRAIAKIVIAGRLIEEGSELNTYNWFKKRSALHELLDFNMNGVGKDGFYDIADELLEYKDDIENQLYKIEKNELSINNSVYLYDLTNTYFEGQCLNNDLAQRGKSKEKRTDCPLVTLALVVDGNGFPVMSQIYEGNKSEPQSLEDILWRLERDASPMLSLIKPTMIMDRGIATKNNLDLLKDRGYPYTIIERRAKQRDFSDEFNDLSLFECMGSEEETVYVKKIECGEIARVLCCSYKKKEKERSMDRNKEKRFIQTLESIQRRIKGGNLKRVDKVWENIGRAKQKYPTIWKYYYIVVNTDTSNKNAVSCTWNKREEVRKEREKLTGCYVIESTHCELGAKDIWKLYMTLNNVEKAFKALKSQLGLRPIYHQSAKRTRGHLFIGVLAYHILITIENELRKKGDHRCWATIRKELSTHNRSTIVYADENGDIHHVRLSSTPESIHTDIFEKLDVSLFRKKVFSLAGSRT